MPHDGNRNRSNTPRPSRKGLPLKLQISDVFCDHSDGFAKGTAILTAEGALPVEYLEPGDRIVTRSGMQPLKNIFTPAPNRFKLTFERNEVIYADGIQVDASTGQALIKVPRTLDASDTKR